MSITRFDDLEGKIRNIVGAYDEVKKRNYELEEKLNNKDLELQEAYEKIRGLNEERDTIRSKVDSLLGLLQDVNIAR
ncbi:MAG: cell division protein ZapB [Syntrophobacterales bacterium]|nr:cell division protein ZapB [Syntrophobacterales bacterium]